jgi:purine-binding chemotaxis protein CheW
MVDLVKIRKKAKKGTGNREQVTDGVPAEPVVAQPEPEPQSSVLSPQSSAKLDKFKQEAGTKREGFVEEVEAAAAETKLELLTFVLAGEHYALDIEHIVEIVTPRAITRVPNADEGIVGIISLRGTIVTVVDTRRKLRHPGSKNGDHPDRRIIVVEKAGETLGFEVDRVLRVVKTDPGAVEPHPVVHASEQHEAIRGVFRHADALTILLDFDKLLA